MPRKTDVAEHDMREHARSVSEQAGELASTAADYIQKKSSDIGQVAAEAGSQAARTARVAAGEAAETLSDVSTVARDLALDGMDRLSAEVARHPIQAIAVAAGLGILLGLMTRR
jgi:ElaB/YqjD/DUF883 family membrane-anchored ribosome-binding protein